MVQEAADHPITITKQGKAVAVMMSIERMEATAETMEVLADPAAMAARGGVALVEKYSARNRLLGINQMACVQDSQIDRPTGDGFQIRRQLGKLSSSMLGATRGQ